MIALKDEFGIQHLKGVCERATSRIYGFIMYTRRHSYIIKVLRDNDFWNELNEISGPNWPIFSIKPLQEGEYKMPGNDRGIISSMMVPIWKEPNENRKYLKFFSLEESKDLPCFIAFIWKDNDELEQVTWKLSNNSEQEAFDSIREVVNIISQTETLILPEYKRTENIFRNVRQNIEGVKSKRQLITRVKKILKIKEFLASL